MMHFFLAFLGFCCISQIKADPVTVTTKYGAIEGSEYSFDGLTADVFFGIPFAEPPIGNLRFQKPQPPTPWTTPLKANNYGPRCYELKPAENNVTISDDCLSLNIIRPKNAQNLPLIVWIHGGAFVFGSGEVPIDKMMNYFTKKNVIFVSIQYRLASLGFLSTVDGPLPGNYGLYDQLQALTFLQEVAVNFGGDPKRITIFGFSAGSAAVSWLGLKKEAESLFSQSIEASGSQISKWAHNEATVNGSAKVIASVGGVTNLNTIDVKQLWNYTVAYDDDGYTSDGSMVWNPRYDGQFIPVNDHVQAIAQSPKRPLLIGFESLEAISFMDRAAASVANMPAEQLAKYFSFAVGGTILKQSFANSSIECHAEGIVEEIIKFYTTQVTNYKKFPVFNAFTQTLSDLFFNIASIREAKLKAAAGHQVYVYLFDLYNTTEEYPYEGASHGNDINSLFFNATDPEAPSTVDALAEILSTFAINGVPSYQNKPLLQVTPDKIPYIKLGKTITVGDDLWADRLVFWDDLAKKFGFDLISGTVVGNILPCPPSIIRGLVQDDKSVPKINLFNPFQFMY